MTSRSILYTSLILPLLVAPVLSAADPKPATPTCPAVVTEAIAHAFPRSTITKCVAEKDHGHDQFEVKLVKVDGGKLEVDVAPDGKILQSEEKIALDKVPAVVMKAFAAKYPKAKAEVAEKQTPATGTPTYELAFNVDGKRKEATFDETGKFIEEE